MVPQLLRVCLALCCAELAGCDRFVEPAPAPAKDQTNAAWNFFVRCEDARLFTEARAGKPFFLLLTLVNQGAATWPDVQMADPVLLSGNGAVRIASRIWDSTCSKLLVDYGSRTQLPGPIVCGQRIDTLIQVDSGLEAGRYHVQVDLLQEGVGWFEGHGNSRILLPVEVQP